MAVYVCVGRTVVGGFADMIGVYKCLKQLAPGCNPQVKKCRPIQAEKRAAKDRSNEARHGQITGIETYNPTTGMRKKITLLRPGEFSV